jgi:hypothetical protein
MIVPVMRKTNFGNGLDDQTNITMNLFNAILESASTRAELECSWEVIKRYINIHGHWEAKKMQPINKQ